MKVSVNVTSSGIWRRVLS